MESKLKLSNPVTGSFLSIIQTCPFLLFLSFPCVFSLWYIFFFNRKKTKQLHTSFPLQPNCFKINLSYIYIILIQYCFTLIHPREVLTRTQLPCLKGRSEHQAWKKMYVIATQSQKGLLRAVENLNLLMAYLLKIQLCFHLCLDAALKCDGRPERTCFVSQWNW